MDLAAWLKALGVALLILMVLFVFGVSAAWLVVGQVAPA